MRFKLYQHLSKADVTENSKGIQRDVVNFLKDPSNYLLNEASLKYLIQKKFLLADGETLVEFKDKKKLINYLSLLATKKQTQRATHNKHTTSITKNKQTNKHNTTHNTTQHNL